MAAVAPALSRDEERGADEGNLVALLSSTVAQPDRSATSCCHHRPGPGVDRGDVHRGSARHLAGAALWSSLVRSWTMTRQCPTALDASRAGAIALPARPFRFIRAAVFEVVATGTEGFDDGSSTPSSQGCDPTPVRLKRVPDAGRLRRFRVRSCDHRDCDSDCLGAAQSASRVHWRRRGLPFPAAAMVRRLAAHLVILCFVARRDPGHRAVRAAAFSDCTAARLHGALRDGLCSRWALWAFRASARVALRRFALAASPRTEDSSLGLTVALFIGSRCA